MKFYDLIIFDLDGTLLDTSPAIFGSVRYAEKQLRLTPIDEDSLSLFVGPPPKTMYKKIYNLDDEQAMRAAQFHREYGRTEGIRKAQPYDGMASTLQELKNRGYLLAVGTLKAQDIAKTVLKENALYDYFDLVVGMDKDETLTKSKIILHIKNSLQSQHALMVGDSQYDYDGAQEAGISFCGVTYGFGFKSSEHFSFTVISTPSELLDLL